MSSSRDDCSGLLGSALVNPYRQDLSPSRRGRRRAVTGAGVAVTAAAAVVGGLGATAAHAGSNAEIGASVVRLANDASLNDGALGDRIKDLLRDEYACFDDSPGLAAIGAHARQLIAAAGGRPGLVQLAKDLAAYTTAKESSTECFTVEQTPNYGPGFSNVSVEPPAVADPYATLRVECTRSAWSPDVDALGWIYAIEACVQSGGPLASGAGQ